jgi:outer membrane immunogenic protein
MKKRWMSGVAALPFAFAGSAMAAAPAPVPYSWTGFYVGANVGGAWGKSGTSASADCNVTFGASPFPYVCDTGSIANGAAFGAGGTGTIRSSAFTGGLQAGYNWQTPNVVVGLETDFGSFHLQGSRQGNGTYPIPFNFPTGQGFTVATSLGTEWLYTFRGRIGVPVTPNLLAYATGGLAVTRIGINAAYSDNNPFFAPGVTGTASGSAVKAGWTVGAGAEWALPGNWSIKAEYLYLDFGSVTANGAITTAIGGGYRTAISTSADLTAQVARIGVNRRF